MLKYLQVTGMTKKTYTVEAKAWIKISMDIEANSREEVFDIVEKHHSEIGFAAPKPHIFSTKCKAWYPCADGFLAEITSVTPINPCMRPFIPGYDD